MVRGRRSWSIGAQGPWLHSHALYQHPSHVEWSHREPAGQRDHNFLLHPELCWRKGHLPASPAVEQLWHTWFTELLAGGQKIKIGTCFALIATHKARPRALYLLHRLGPAAWNYSRTDPARLLRPDQLRFMLQCMFFFPQRSLNLVVPPS